MEATETIPSLIIFVVWMLSSDSCHILIMGHVFLFLIIDDILIPYFWVPAVRQNISHIPDIYLS